MISLRENERQSRQDDTFDCARIHTGDCDIISVRTCHNFQLSRFAPCILRALHVTLFAPMRLVFTSPKEAQPGDIAEQMLC